MCYINIYILYIYIYIYRQIHRQILFIIYIYIHIYILYIYTYTYTYVCIYIIYIYIFIYLIYYPTIRKNATITMFSWQVHSFPLLKKMQINLRKCFNLIKLILYFFYCIIRIKSFLVCFWYNIFGSKFFWVFCFTRIC